MWYFVHLHKWKDVLISINVHFVAGRGGYGYYTIYETLATAMANWKCWQVKPVEFLINVDLEFSCRYMYMILSVSKKDWCYNILLQHLNSCQCGYLKTVCKFWPCESSDTNNKSQRGENEYGPQKNWSFCLKRFHFEHVDWDIKHYHVGSGGLCHSRSEDSGWNNTAVWWVHIVFDCAHACYFS